MFLPSLRIPGVDVAAPWISRVRSIVFPPKVQLIASAPSDHLLLSCENTGHVPLHDRQEMTLYVKGFLAKNERPNSFDSWANCHRQLCERQSHAWDPTMYGWRWPSGNSVGLGRIPIPWTTINTLVFNLYRAKAMSSKLHPALFLACTAQDAILILGSLYWQYRTAQRESLRRAEMLAETLQHLRREHDYVRIVAHSLGCKHVLEAIQHLPHASRPDELHLCAPAVTAPETMRLFRQPSRGRTFVYYSPKDLLLSTMFRMMEDWELALGNIGPKMMHEQLQARTPLPGDCSLGSVVDVPVCTYFNFFVHGQYRKRFHEFARAMEMPLDSDTTAATGAAAAVASSASLRAF